MIWTSAPTRIAILDLKRQFLPSQNSVPENFGHLRGPHFGECFEDSADFKSLIRKVHFLKGPKSSVPEKFLG